MFCCPDLRYHDRLKRPLAPAMRRGGNRVFLSYWQEFGGLNDRFAICAGREAIMAYGLRLRLAETFCREGATALHSERLLAFSLAQDNIRVDKIGTRASRVRLGGQQSYEDFARPWLCRINQTLQPHAVAFADQTGPRALIRNILRRLRP